MTRDARQSAPLDTHRNPEAEATQRYDSCLEQPGMATATASALSQAAQHHGLVVDGRPLCTVLRPRFLSAERHAHLAEISATLAALFERAASHLLASDAMLDLVGASQAEREIWSIDPGYPGYTLTSRLDSFMGGDHPQFVEYNAESPAGIGFCDRLVDIFNDLPVTQAWRDGRTPEPATGRQLLLDTLLKAYHAWGGTGTPSMAIIDWDDVITRRDFELCAELFRERGVPVIITDPRTLRYERGSLWCGSERITLVYRRVLLHELLAKSSELQPLLRAYRDGAICMVNSPRSKLLHKKSVFALLSDQTLGLQVSPEEREIVNQTVPWTRRLVEGQTEYDGESDDLVPLLLRHPDRFALKPTDDYGGRGVVLGWDCTNERWVEAIERGLGEDFVVQARVEVPEVVFPTYVDGELRHTAMHLDTNPLLFDGHMGVVLTRLSGSALLNVTAGTGSAVPTFVLPEEEA